MHAEQSDGSAFASLLTGIQKRTSLSYQRIADAAGVDRSQVWRWVNAGASPGYEPVRRLAAWLIEERPEVAGPASGLLAAAGYEAAPGPAAHDRASVFALLPAEEGAQLRPHYAEIIGRAEAAAAAHPGEVLKGAWVFPKDPLSAASWDEITANVTALPALFGSDPEVITRRVAEGVAVSIAIAESKTGNGSAAVLPQPLRAVSSP